MAITIGQILAFNIDQNGAPFLNVSRLVLNSFNYDLNGSPFIGTSTLGFANLTSTSTITASLSTQIQLQTDLVATSVFPVAFLDPGLVASLPVTTTATAALRTGAGVAANLVATSSASASQLIQVPSIVQQFSSSCDLLNGTTSITLNAGVAPTLNNTMIFVAYYCASGYGITVSGFTGPTGSILLSSNSVSNITRNVYMMPVSSTALSQVFTFTTSSGSTSALFAFELKGPVVVEMFLGTTLTSVNPQNITLHGAYSTGLRYLIISDNNNWFGTEYPFTSATNGNLITEISGNRNFALIADLISVPITSQSGNTAVTFSGLRTTNSVYDQLNFYSPGYALGSLINVVAQSSASPQLTTYIQLAASLVATSTIVAAPYIAVPVQVQMKAATVSVTTSYTYTMTFDNPLTVGNTILVMSNSYEAMPTGIGATAIFSNASTGVCIYTLPITGATTTTVVCPGYHFGTDYVSTMIVEIYGPFVATLDGISQTSGGISGTGTVTLNNTETYLNSLRYMFLGLLKGNGIRSLTGGTQLSEWINSGNGDTYDWLVLPVTPNTTSINFTTDNREFQRRYFYLELTTPIILQASLTATSTITAICGITFTNAVATATGSASDGFVGLTILLVSAIGLASAYETDNFIATALLPAIGSSTGIESDSIIGASSAASVGLADGSDTVTGEYFSVDVATASATGDATADAFAISTADSFGLASAFEVDNIIGRSTAIALANATGSSGITSIAASISRVVGLASGVADVTTDITVTAETIATSDSPASVDFIGMSYNHAAAQATGEETDAVIGGAMTAATTATFGSSTGDATGACYFNAIASVTGIASDSIIGASTARSLATSFGASDAYASEASLYHTTGTASGTSTSNGVDRSTAAATASSAASSTTSAVGGSINTATGTTVGGETDHVIAMVYVASTANATGDEADDVIATALLSAVADATGTSDSAAPSFCYASGVGSASGDSTMNAVDFNAAQGLSLAYVRIAAISRTSNITPVSRAIKSTSINRTDAVVGSY